MLLMYATSFLTSFTEVAFLQVRAEGAFLSSLEIEPVAQVFESVAWETELVIWLWQCAYESPVHAAKRLWTIRRPVVAPNNISKSVDLLQTLPSTPGLRGRQLLFILFISSSIVCRFLKSYPEPVVFPLEYLLILLQGNFPTSKAMPITKDMP